VRLSAVARIFREGTRRRVLFERLDASFARARITAIVGRSGTGKSTLLNLASGIDLPDAGEVWVGGVELSALTERERTLYRRRAIGLVFQFFNLIPTLSVEENLLLPLELLGVPAGDSRARVRALLERVGLADRALSFADRLSGGEQQRVAIARALIHRPALVLADEPTGNLDAESAAEALRLLSDLSAAQGASMLMVTHSEEAARIADEVFTLENGELRAQEKGKRGHA